MATGGDGKEPRDEGISTDLDHFGDPVEIHAKLEKAWRGVWQENKTRGDNWETMMATLNTMPGFPARNRWTGYIVGDTLKRMSRNKAPGLDEWRVYEMRAWPPHLHDAAATLLEEVEHTGKWPTELGGPLGILLEKGGTTDPMDRRPIWLMPVLYRVWTSRRSRDWAKWRLGWEGETEFRGADTLAWDVALAMEAAEANGDEFGLLALDWREAYDGIDLQTLGGIHWKGPKFRIGPGYH